MTTIVRNGLLFDGTGSKGIHTDVIIQQGKVKAIQKNAPTIEGAQEIDAEGKWIMELTDGSGAKVTTNPEIEQ